MASSASYAEGDAAQMSYVNQNGNGTTAEQQQQHVPTDPDLQLHENLTQHLQRNPEALQAANAQAHQYNPAAMNAAHQFQTPPRPTHSPQQMAQSAMNFEGHPEFDDGSSRKRSKVSRACDECRRKKIRCDATSENGPEACSSCKRTGARCQFSRQPMKRGPSKGYIKELADRLNTLENQIRDPHAPAPGYDYIPGDQGLGLHDVQPPQFSRKRTHSMSEGLLDAYGSNRANVGWPGQDPQREPFAANGANQGLHRRPSYGEAALAGSLMTGSNEGIIKAYYTNVHTILPILPHDSSLLNRLTDCPAKLREAFFSALEYAVRSFTPASVGSIDNIVQLKLRTLEVLELSQHVLNDADNSRQFYNHLVYCQALAFLAFAADKSGPGAMMSSAELIGRVAGRISELGINDAKILNSIRDQDRETFEVARRLLWTVFILDRFHASSMSKDLLMPVYCGNVSRDDQGALGEVGYHVARGADIVGQIAYLVRAGSVPNLDPNSPHSFAAMTATSPSALYLNGQLSRYRESLEMTNLNSSSAPYLIYQYLRIIVARLSPFTPSSDIWALTRDLLNNLIGGPITPLNHFFASFVATSFTDLADRPESQIDAFSSIKEMADAIANGRILHRSVDGSGWDAAIRELLLQKQGPTPPGTSGDQNAIEQLTAANQPNMAGLQHLAAAAVGEREGADARPLSSGGSDMKPDVAAAVAAASEAAAAQATAAAAQKQLQNQGGSGNGNGNTPDSSALVKEGFLNALT